MPENIRYGLNKMHALLAIFFVVYLSFGNKPCFAEDTNSQFILGIGAHLHGLNNQGLNKNLYYIKQLRPSIVRWDVPWKMVEEEKDLLKIPSKWDYTVNNLNSQGIDSILILDYGNKFYDNGDKPLSESAIKAYVRYAKFVVNHFKGRIKYYEVWNEWNGRVGNTQPGRSEDYARLLKAVYPELKKIDKDIVVIGGSFSSSSYDTILGLKLNERYKANQFDAFLNLDISNYLDAIGIHPYVVYRDGEFQSYDGFKRLIKSLTNKIRSTAGLDKKPIYITELGWSTASSNSRGVTEDDQKTFTLSAINDAKKLGVSMLVIYELIDGGTNSANVEDHFGILRYDESEKPIFDILKNLDRLK